MEIYLVNLLVVTIGGYFAQNLPKKYNTQENNINNYFFSIIVSFLVCLSGFRYKVGTDYGNYSEVYIYMGMEPINWEMVEIGFELLMKNLYKVNENPQIMFFIIALITNIGISLFIKRNSNNLGLSMYLYVTTFVYYGTMNGMRQYLASSILALGFKHIINGEFRKYIKYIIIAMLFHISALVMIPIFFLVRKDTYSKINKCLLGIFILAFLFYQQFLTIIFKIFGNTKYGYYQEHLVNTSNGANIIRIVVWLVPVIIILKYRNRAIKLYSTDMNIIINLCILGSMFMCLAYKHVYFARFCMYFDIFYLILIPRICTLFDTKSNRLILYFIMVGYFVYSTLLLLSGESQIYPYKYTLDLF